ncbi:MAG: hypothetical protein ACT4R6_11675 [Gemmatimonadaceae bacterium]
MTATSDTGHDTAPRQPRYARSLAALIFAGCALTLAHPALRGLFLVNPSSDQYIAGYAFREFAAQSLKSGEGFPLWNPYLYGGMPYVAAMHGDIFYPTFLLRLVLPTDLAMTWGFIVHVVLAGYFAFLFLRVLGLSYWAAVIGGIAYMLGGNVAGLVSPGHDGKLFIAALTPLALYLLVRFVRDGRLWAWGLLAITVGLAVLSPHPQLLQYMLLSGGAFALVLGFSDIGGARLERRVAVRRLIFALGAVLLGGLMGAIQYLPVTEYVDWSPRAGGKKGWEHAISYSMPPAELINTYLPQFSGILERYWGENGIHLHSEYLGVTVMLLAALAWSRRLAATQRRIMWWATGTLIVAGLWALGGNTPFYRVVYAVVPGTKFFRAPSIMLYVVQFSIAVLAALGAERAIRGDVTRRYMIGWAVLALAVAALASAGGLTSVAVTVADATQADRAIANNSALIAGAWRSALFVGLTLALLLLIVQRRVGAVQAAAGLAAVAVLDLWSIERLYWRFSPQASQLFAPNDVTRYLDRLDQPARVIAAPLGEMTAQRDPYLGASIRGGDGLMVHDQRVTLGYHGNQLDRYDVLAGVASGYQQIGNPNFWALSNSRFFLTNLDSLPIPGAVRVVGPVPSPAGTPLSLFDLPGEQPFAWVAPVIVKADDESVLNTLLDPRFDVRRAALFAPNAAVAGEQVSALPEPLAIDVRVSDYEPGRFAVELSRPAPNGSALVVSENFYPGWSARADGTPVSVWRADMSLMGVALPPNARRLEFTFSSPPFERGRAITLIAFAVALAATLAGYLRPLSRGGAPRES